MTGRQFLRFIVNLRKMPDYTEIPVTVEYRCGSGRGSSSGVRYITGRLLSYDLNAWTFRFWDEEKDIELLRSYRSIKSIHFEGDQMKEDQIESGTDEEPIKPERKENVIQDLPALPLAYSSLVRLYPYLERITQVVANAMFLDPAVRKRIADTPPGDPIMPGLYPDDYHEGIELKFTKDDLVSVSVCESIDQAIDLIKQIASAIMTNCRGREEDLIRALGDGIISGQTIRAEVEKKAGARLPRIGFMGVSTSEPEE